MRLSLPLAILLAILTASAHAQIVEVYATSSNHRFSNVETGVTYTSTAGYQDQYTSFWTSGIGGGVTLNFLPLPLVSLGLDVRGSTKSGTVGADTGMVGLKLTAKPPAIHIKPYVQVSAGYVATRSANVSNINPSPGGDSNTFTNKYAAYEVLGGIDLPLVHFVDLRLIEIGGGQGILGGSTGNPSLFAINSGIVLHF